MGTVISLHGKEIIPVLEEWIEQARKGELVALSFAAVMNDDTVCEGWMGNVDNHCVKMYGGINILRDAYFHMMIEHYDDASMGSRND